MASDLVRLRDTGRAIAESIAQRYLGLAWVLAAFWGMTGRVDGSHEGL